MKLPVFIGFTVLAAAAYPQSAIIPASTGHGNPTFNCATGDTYGDMDNNLVWICKTPNNWITTPAFAPFGQVAAGGASLVTTQPQTFQGNLAMPQVLSKIVGATYYYASSFPNSCTVGGVGYTTQLDCAWRTALATTATSTANPSVVVEPGVNYTTCAGLPLILPGAMGSSAVNLTSIGNNSGNNLGGFTNNGVATITQSCSIGVGTISLPEVAGSAWKQISILGVSIDANHLAPYAIQILGLNTNSAFRNIEVANGTTGPAVFGVQFDHTNGATESVDIEDWKIVDNCGVVNGCGGGAAATVTLTGGVPSFTVTAPGSNLDSNTIATLVGYQNGTRNTPCSFMGVTTPVISGGQLTGVNTTATGCAGQVYVSFTDIRAPQYGLDLENVADAAKISGLDIRTGSIAGLNAIGASNDTFYGVHAWGQGLFGARAGGYATFVGTNCGEVSLACFDNATSNAKTTAIGTTYFSGTQYQGYSLFRNELSTSTFKIVGVTCQNVQTAEYHTLANIFGVIDTNAQATSVNTLGNSLKDVEYCGSGTGETLNVIPGNQLVLGNLSSPGTTSLSQSISFPLNSTVFLDCTATGWTKAPTVSGSVVTFPSNGFNNGGSISCTDFDGRVTTQSIPNAGGASPQTFDLTTQFATSGATWIEIDAQDNKIVLNSPTISVQNGTMQAGTGGTITATTAGSFTGSPSSLAIVPPGTASTTPLTVLQSGLTTGSLVRMQIGVGTSNFNSGLLFFQYQGGAGSTTNRVGLNVPGGQSVWLDGQGFWNTPAIQINGTTFTASGCANSSLFGGATAGQFASGTTGTCTVAITTGLTASHGYACFANDLTTPADTIKQTASSTTTATLSGTTTTGDVINFACTAY